MADETPTPPGETTIDKDVFAYDGTPMTQCISGFGRNFNAAIDEALDEEADGSREDHPAEVKSRLHWHTGELVRWCQHFNEKSQRLAADLAVACRQRDALEKGLHAARAEATAVFADRPQLDLASTDGHVVLFSALRYALGRQSYVVSSAIAAVRLAMPFMDAGRRQTIARDIRRAEAEGNLGMASIDAPAWIALAAELEAL